LVAALCLRQPVSKTRLSVPVFANSDGGREERPKGSGQQIIRDIRAIRGCSAVSPHGSPITGSGTEIASARIAELTAKAHNRRGDALLLLGRPREALSAFDAAQPLAPNDPYILFNRGRAYLALGDKPAARADFTAAGDPKFDRPVARKLAREALAGME